ncbi:leukocyte elastase inhibitor-like [Oreochromis aureus]|uniref:leukocyte elastase inhibitor-like n=1 Tax=Oreochromis aureus TaxID=47969 RepID=UPI001954A05A|nr:leukocyte elastase inhibitor-like [Oreochromis aureus]
MSTVIPVFNPNKTSSVLQVLGFTEVENQSWQKRNRHKHNKIKDLLSQDAVDSLTKLVVVNAIYFKGSWNTQFKEEMTADAQFRLNKNDTKPVKMMHQKSKFPFATIPEANCKSLEMPYKGNDLSMLIFLPNDIEDDTTGLEKLEKELTYQNFADWTRPDMMSPNEVDVKLPRFKMEEKYDLEKILTNGVNSHINKVTRSAYFQLRNREKELRCKTLNPEKLKF